MARLRQSFTLEGPRQRFCTNSHRQDTLTWVWGLSHSHAEEAELVGNQDGAQKRWALDKTSWCIW